MSTRRAVRRGEGQWAHGYREPLNATERFKRDDDWIRRADESALA